MTHPHQITNVDDARAFVRAGRAVFTLASQKTGARFTYKVSRKMDDEGNPVEPAFFFVSLKTGPESDDWSYLGVLDSRGFLRLTAKSCAKAGASSVLALSWTLSLLDGNVFPNQLEFWHEGRCGRCSRPLTVPESIRNGIGPECIKHVGFVASFMGA